MGKEGATSVRPLASWKSFHLDVRNRQNSEKQAEILYNMLVKAVDVKSYKML